MVLVGLMGAGKTSVGRILARRLAWPLSDSDEWILARTGETVRRLRAEIGVDAMHRLESDHLVDALADRHPSVVAAAASIADDPRARKALAAPGVVTVWLRARPATLATRFDSAAHRPAYGDDPDRFLAEQAESRYPEYEAMSQIAVDVDTTSAEDTAAAVMEKLSDLAR